jgi:hypothetical protein
MMEALNKSKFARRCFAALLQSQIPLSLTPLNFSAKSRKNSLKSKF